MILQDRIKMISKEFGANQEDILKILRDNGIDCSIGTIKGWWQGKTKSILPKYSIILSKYFKINRQWLEDGLGEMKLSDDTSSVSLNELSLIAHTLSEDSIAIKFYEDIRASAGNGFLNGECKPSYINLLPELLPTKSKNIEAVKVDGDSMTGTIEDGDIIFIDKNYTTQLNGKIYVVLLCDEVYVKRIFKDPSNGKLILKSDNPVYPQFEANCDDFKIIGKVIANMKIKEL
jgi:phage repressor protein C with HTH and peptisase S24 domain